MSVESILTEALNQAKPSAPHLEAVNLNDPEGDVIDALMDGPEFFTVDAMPDGYLWDRGIIDMDEGLVTDAWGLSTTEDELRAAVAAWIDEVVL